MGKGDKRLHRKVPQPEEVRLPGQEIGVCHRIDGMVTTHYQGADRTQHDESCADTF